MKRSSSCTQHQMSLVHIADGFYDDCDEVISRCSQFATIDYQSFCIIWKEMNLGYLYQGRSSGAEISELAEEVIHIAKHYMVRDTSNFEESVVGLFLAYGLLKLQPYPEFAWMRIIPEDVPTLRRIEMIARREKRFDVLYILGDVLINHSQYHAAERERGLERSYRKYLEGCTSIDKLGVRPKGVFYRQNEELDIVREMGSLTRQYVRAKNNVVGNVPNPSLQYIDENLADDLNTSLRKIINGLVEDPVKNDDDDDTDEDDSDAAHYEALQAIKHRAMANIVNPMKHLTAVEDRKIEKITAHKSDLKCPTGKVKAPSPTKPVSGSKRKIPNRRSPKIVKKLKLSEFEMSGSRTHNVADRISDETELNLKDFLKDTTVPEESTDNKLDVCGNTEVFSAGSENHLDIEIDSLPVIIRTGNQGEVFEIEIFDEYKGDENKETRNTPETSEVKPSTSDTANGRDDNKSKKRIIKKKAALPMKLNMPERRDMKRNILKAKFKKMGMLPAANFIETSEDSVCFQSSKARIKK